jgi:hypothetical protein
MGRFCILEQCSIEPEGARISLKYQKTLSFIKERVAIS